MQIGKNRHKITNKKTYRKPVMEDICIDSEVVLICVSNTDPPFSPSANESITNDKPVYDEIQQYPKDNSPFGGGTPSYER
jgi:hypothetical protein